MSGNLQLGTSKINALRHKGYGDGEMGRTKRHADSFPLPELAVAYNDGYRHGKMARAKRAETLQEVAEREIEAQAEDEAGMRSLEPHEHPHQQTLSHRDWPA